MIVGRDTEGSRQGRQHTKSHTCTWASEWWHTALCVQQRKQVKQWSRHLLMRGHEASATLSSASLSSVATTLFRRTSNCLGFFWALRLISFLRGGDWGGGIKLPEPLNSNGVGHLLRGEVMQPCVPPTPAFNIFCYRAVPRSNKCTGPFWSLRLVSSS